MASYIHGSAAPKPEQDWREEQLRRRRQQDIGKNVKKHHRIRRNQERAMYMDLPYVIILLSLIHISEPTRLTWKSRMPSSA